MQLNPLLKFRSHFFLWLIPACLLWWISANSIIIPGLRVVVAKTASVWFYREQVQLHAAPGDKWFIRTNLLAKSWDVATGAELWIVDSWINGTYPVFGEFFCRMACSTTNLVYF